MEIFQDGELETEMNRLEFRTGSLSSWWNLFSSSYEDVIRSLACPPRAEYSLHDLGESCFNLENGKECIREDFGIENCRAERIECSFWRYAQDPTTSTQASPPPCIIYLHGLSSSRQECAYLREKILSAGFSILAIDLSGSGMSEGDRVSFGLYEKDDIQAVVDNLYATNKASAVGIWGRCLGGAAALFYAKESINMKYKSVSIDKKDVKSLRVRQCRKTGHFYIGHSKFSFNFGFGGSTEYGPKDFVILSVDERVIDGRALTLSSFMGILNRSKSKSIELRGYEILPQDCISGRNNFVFGYALDSTFGDMQQMITDMLSEIAKSAEKRDLVLPQALLKTVARIIGRSIRKRAGFHFRDVYVLDDLHRLRTPSIFVCTHKLDFIRPEYTAEIFTRYGGEKKMMRFDGEHDGNRPEHIGNAMCEFLRESFKSRPSRR